MSGGPTLRGDKEYRSLDLSFERVFSLAACV